MNEKEYLYSLALQAAGIGAWQYHTATGFLSADNITKDLLGFQHSSFPFEEWLECIHAADRLLVHEAFNAAMTPLGKGGFEVQFRRSTDQGLWLHCKGRAFFDRDGKAEKLAGIIQVLPVFTSDAQPTVALALESQRALAATEAMFRHVSNSSPTGLWLSDEEGGLTYLNQALVDWTGMPYQELLGAGWANAIIEEDRARSAEAFSTAVANRSHYDVMFRMKKGDDNVIWCRAAGDPYYREDGTYAGYAGFCMDMHELLTATKELQAAELRFRSMIEQAPMAIGLLRGRDMMIEVGNDKIFQIWGKPSSITGSKLIDALPELKGQVFMDLLENVYDTGNAHFGNGVLAKLVRNEKLEDVYFDFAYTPLRDGEGNVTGIMVLATEVTSQVLAKIALEQSEAKFRSLIEEAPFATGLYVGPEMIIETANEAMIRLWGKDESVIGKKLHIALPELEGQPFLKLLEEVYTTGIAYHTQEARADLLVDGILKTFYFNFTYKPLRNNEGNVYAILNMAVDVTEQFNARKKIEESELFSRSIFYNSPIAKLVFTGEDMVIQTVNENMLGLLGRDESVVGKPFMQAVPEFLDYPLMQRLRHVYTTGETYYQPEEKLDIIRYGELYTGYYNYIYKALRNTEGEIYGIIVTATEVTQQVLARQKTEEAESQLRGAIELAQLGTWEIDLAKGSINYSDRLREWHGIKPGEEITMEAAWRYVDPTQHQQLKLALAQAIEPGSAGGYDTEYTVLASQTGKERILHAQGKAFFDQEGKAYKITGTVQDVTVHRKQQLALEQEVQERTEQLRSVNEELIATNDELFESNERLMRSNEDLAQYAYVASHDLQEPLRKIRMFSSLLSNKTPLAGEGKKWVDKIGQSAERMSMLIQSLLEFSRLLKSEMMMQSTDLSKIMTEVTNDFELTIEEKGARLFISSLPAIEAVSLQMNQLFYNLLSNSLKFTRPDVRPQIEVHCQPITAQDLTRYILSPIAGARYYHIRFVDNGIGFDTQYADQIFEVFKRLHGRDIYPGSGIGLAVCKRIVTNHHGHMYVESAPGEGSVFHIILPDRQGQSN